MKTKHNLAVLLQISLIILITAIVSFSFPAIRVAFAELERILSENPSWAFPLKENFSSFQKGTELGSAVSMTGDVTGDGLDDIIVGAQKYEVNIYREGAVFVFSGSYNGLYNYPIWEMGGGQQGSLFGCAVSSLGDVNGDQQNDIAVGSCELTYNADDVTRSKAGAAFVYYGPLNSLKTSEDWVFKGDQSDARLGSALSDAGDINGDGIDDLIVGAKNYSEGLGLNNNGKVFVFYGSDPHGLSLTPDWEAIGESSSAQFGSSVANAGDINNDGLTDLIIGAPRPSDVGKVYVYLNSETGLPSTPSQVLTNNEEEARFGAAIAGIGYVNNDDYADVLVGAPYAMNSQDEKSGCVYLYWGSADGLSTEPWKQCGNIAYEQFGNSVAAAGDMNDDDTFDDFLVGIPKYSDQLINPGEEEQGAVHLYFGSSIGVRSDYFESILGGKAETMFGAAIGGVGDLNNDGKPDVIVGAPTYKVDSKNPIGRILAYYAGEAGIPDLDLFSIFLPVIVSGN
jgi:hypothetical protein